MGESAHKILVVDDDRGVRTSLERALTFEGYSIETASDGLAALENIDETISAMVLDVSMPNMDGLEVCRRVRSSGNDLPILVLTARHATPDRVAGLDAGADDYLVKPFALEELLARLRALLRRVDKPASEADVLEFGELRLDRGSRMVYRGERRIDLTRTEFSLLELLMERPGQVMTRDQIYERVWGYDSSTSSNSLEVYVGYLRRKTEENGESRYVHTVRGFGYVVRAD
ncbi:MAG: response regulator transcription factor [Actinomycetia bacterium]|nr:response regulator transcription factor [Actinomycetes bacterium]MCP4962220.1 response regulator transcription factor [Actinomycetes bacterium]